MRVSCFLILPILCFPAVLSSQNPDPWINQSHPPWYPKTYLHTDREVYFPGDSLWFRAYYLDGQSHMPVPGAFTLYVEFLDAQGRALERQVRLLQDGYSEGKIEIPDTLATGTYLLRACTDYQRSLGEDAFFHRTLKITSVESRMEQAAGVPEQAEGIDVAFLPEGGYLLEDMVNTVGIKALDQHGLELPVEGEILNDRGEVAGRFRTIYRGMGVCKFHPRKGEEYHVQVKGYPDFNYVFNDVLEAGIKLEYAGESGEHVLFRVISNSVTKQGKQYYFAILHRGRILFQQGFVQRNGEFPLKIQREALLPGINRLVLLDDQYTPLSERLYFSSNPEVNHIRIVPDQNQYRPRSEVRLEFFDEEAIRGSAVSDLSLAVVDAYALPASGPAQTLLSWLLIDSELQGSIPSPAAFFEEDGQLSSVEKLDLLMLTHGWSRYLWTSFSENDVPSATEPHEGFSLNGNLTHPFTRKPIARGEVELYLFNRDLHINDQVRTDKNGLFHFENLLFADTAALFLQGRNRKGKQYTVLDIDPLYTPLGNSALSYLPDNTEKINYSTQLYEQKYYGDMDLKNWALENGSIFLEEVTISRKKVTGDGHYRVYPKPFNSFKITNKDYGYQNLLQYLQGRVAGVMVLGNTIMMRGPGSFGPSPPLFLLDGTPVSDQEMVVNLPMSAIDLVEVLKNPAEVAIFGVRGGSGVISVFTKKGGVSFVDNYTPGTLAKRITGYEAHKEFYVPRYTPENKESERPDHRITLYWNPSVVTEQGEAAASFYTSDDITRYRVLVEGITNTGEVCLGSAEFEVSRMEEGAGF